MSGFAGDRVEEWTPPSFALELVRRLRRHRGLSHPPSVRSTVAIPRLLTARYFRTGMLLPKDYLEAAVLTSAPEDQALVEVVARELLFPRATDEAPAAAQSAPVAQAAPAASLDDDPLAGLLGDLAALDLDLDGVASLDELLAEDPAPTSAFDLFETLYSSAVAGQRALAELTLLFGGPSELVAIGATTEPRVRSFVRERLMAEVGALRPDHVRYGCEAELGEELAHAARDPWELAGALAGTGREALLAPLLEELLASSDPHAQGRTIAFLRPYEDQLKEVELAAFADSALERADDLSGYGSLLVGLDTWIAPPPALIEASAADNVQRALAAARLLDDRFGEGLTETVLEAWAGSLAEPPTLDALAPLAVDVPLWGALLDQALDRHLARIRAAGASGRGRGLGPADGLPELVIDAAPLAGRLASTGRTRALEAGAILATESLCSLWDAAQLLPMLDAFLEHRVLPSDAARVIAHGESLGVDPNEILDRLGDALRQLQQAIMDGDRDAARYRLLVERVDWMPRELMEECAAHALAGSNLEAMAALLAVDLGGASAVLPEQEVMDCLGYKGIGGGDNLIKQWFTHRGGLRDTLKPRIKEVAQRALLDAAFEWIGKGDGSGEQGLVSQSRTRPFSAGDELDAIDLEGTLDALVGAGRTLESVGPEDLLVRDGTRGAAVLTVLIDISGSMTGSDLAMCAISVLMLLGRLRPEEIALAAFESDTHVIKALHDPVDLSEVADAVLELEATGGTRVDAALRWAAEQLESASDVDMRLLFLLSDFCFFERPDELRGHGERLADAGARLLAASHGYSNESTVRAMVDTIGGRSLKLKKLRELPELLLAALRDVADGLMR